MINEDRYDTKEKLLQGTAQATLHIIDGLDWNLNLSYQTNSTSTTSTIPHKLSCLQLFRSTDRQTAAPQKTSASRWKLT